MPESVLREPLLFMVSIGVLTYLFGLLFYVIQMKAKREKIDKSLLESRLKSLEIQLNSHFIHNTLNTIIALIEFDKERAVSGLIKLSQFLRKLMQERSLISLDLIQE